MCNLSLVLEKITKTPLIFRVLALSLLNQTQIALSWRGVGDKIPLCHVSRQ